ncbi:MAG TPA: ATP-binding protein [Longimicrobiales bacterium]|nr:ATP-binding protein [Longimicrobiales bacterium]
MVHPVGMLRWLFMGRLMLAFGVFAGVALVWDDTPQADTLIATLSLLAAIGFTTYSIWYTSIQQRPAGTNFLYSQVIFDALLVTAIVHITGGMDSSFPPAYILVIAAGALLLPLSGGILVAALASILYFADLIWFHVPHIENGATVRLILWPVPTPLASALMQIALFAIVAVVVGALGDRLRRTGHALGQMESELRQLRLETDDILGAIDTGLVTVDDVGRLMYINMAAESVLSLDSGGLLNQPILEELDRHAPGLGGVIRKTSSTGQPVRRYEIRMRNGVEERVLGVRTTLLERPGAPWITAVFQDITDSRHIEDLLRRTERLQAVAELGASLAHEIKNPLASIRSAVEQLDGSQLNEQDQRILRRLVVSESDRVSRLLSEFMEFSRVEVRRRSQVDIAKVAADAIRLVEQHPDAKGGATIEFQAPHQEVLVDGDPDLLHRAVFNLVLNAVQHSGDSGRVHVELAQLNKREIPPTVSSSASVRLLVRDSGPGIPEEEIARIFDPFFTTREGGTGLGLAMVHRAVEAHEGTILVDGYEGHGAQFSVYLPQQGRRRNT